MNFFQMQSMRKMIDLKTIGFYVRALPLAALLVMGSCRSQPDPNKNIDSTRPVVQVAAIKVPGGYGYDVIVDGKRFIHQNFIPAIPGNRAFQSEADAIKVGTAVVQKIKKREIPSITKEELQSWGISFNE